MGVKAGAFDGLTEIPAASLPGGPGGAVAGVLAYKLVAGDSGAADWKLAVSTEIIESWVRAEVAGFLTVSDTLASGRALVRYDIQNAPVKEFRLKIPTAWKNVEITGANIRRRDQTGGEWRVELQNKVKGIFLLSVTWEQPGNLQTNQLAVTGVEALGVERETGTLAILAKSPLQVSAGSASGELVRIDEREIPEWAGTGAAMRAGHESVALAYRYTRPGYQLVAQVKRFEDAAVLQALVDNLHLTTVVADDGQMMTEMSLGIHNNGRQDLEVELPAGAHVWSAFVAGQPVRPTEREGRLLLPLERSGPDGAPVLVELTYVAADKFPKGKGRLEFVSPKVDMPLKNARWEFYLPPDYDYRDFAGSMAREIEAAPVYQSYSLFEYSRQESSKQATLKAEMKSVVSNAQQQSAANNVQELNRAYNQARRGGGWRDDEVDREVRKIEGDLRKAQGSNLISAQRAYTIENLDKLGLLADAPSAQPAVGMFNYDADAAEQQWVKLQQAQELGVTRLQPLRVNLPTRGLRHSFAQVLQTEIRKPMTVQLTAQSNKGASWTERTALAAGGFLLLWALAAWLARRRTETAAQPAS